jgi:undecaprenyl diphosphate synthase
MNSIKHVAVIMDGNGRWAKERNRPRIWGHIRGSQKVSSVVTAACEYGLESLTMYAFSTENWKRPNTEVSGLFKILKKFLAKERKTILENDIKFNVIGNYKVLNSEIVSLIDNLVLETASNKGLNLSLAINYGGRAEIINAVNDFLKESKSNEITENDLSNHLYNKNINDVDLVIRTAGEQRISNFLLWQICYSEFYFSETKWPDFSAEEFVEILDKVSNRERRFGSLDGIQTTSDRKSNKNNLKLMS